jgi:hypothetical protein
MDEENSMSMHQMSNAKRGPTQPTRRGGYDNTQSFENHLSPRNLAVPGSGKKIAKPQVPANPFGESLMQEAGSPRLRMQPQQERQKSQIKPQKLSSNNLP